MKYIRLKSDGIIDLGKIKLDEENNPYYKDFRFRKLINKDGQAILRYSAVGRISGKRQNFSLCFCSPFIAASDTIQELCDAFVSPDRLRHITFMFGTFEEAIGSRRHDVLACIWAPVKLSNGETGYKLEPVATLNEKGELELL